MKLILISGEEQQLNEVLRLEQMFLAGLELFHFRKPDWSEAECIAFLDRLQDPFFDRVVLNDHGQLSERYPVRGVHQNLRNERAKASWNSRSCHTVEELAALKPEDYEYVFFSPVFPSISKEGHTPQYSQEEIAEAVKKCAVPVIALGGITAERVPDCEQMGFSGVAVLGCVWSALDPYEEFQILHKACQSSAVPY